MSQTIALKMVQASLATAMSYLSVVWGILSGYLIFNEVSQQLCNTQASSNQIITMSQVADFMHA